EPLPKLPVGRAVWKPAPDFATSAAAWLTAGAAHHTVMTTAVGIDVFRDFAEIAEVELLVIDDSTTLGGFQRELKWNAAYYRLAQGSKANTKTSTTDMHQPAPPTTAWKEALCRKGITWPATPPQAPWFSV